MPPGDLPAAKPWQKEAQTCGKCGEAQCAALSASRRLLRLAFQCERPLCAGDLRAIAMQSLNVGENGRGRKAVARPSTVASPPCACARARGGGGAMRPWPPMVPD